MGSIGLKFSVDGDGGDDGADDEKKTRRARTTEMHSLSKNNATFDDRIGFPIRNP